MAPPPWEVDGLGPEEEEPTYGEREVRKHTGRQGGWERRGMRREKERTKGGKGVGDNQCKTGSLANEKSVSKKAARKQQESSKQESKQET